MIEAGNFFGEESAVFEIPGVFHFRTMAPTEVYQISGSVLSDIPAVRWKLYETYEKRMGALISESCTTPMFQWRDEYSVNIQAMDTHHTRLFTMAYRLYDAVNSGETTHALEDALDFLIRYSQFHFSGEEDLMKQYGYPDCGAHVAKHRALVEEIVAFRDRMRSGDAKLTVEFIDFLREWVINHILSDDRKYGPFLNEKGVY